MLKYLGFTIWDLCEGLWVNHCGNGFCEILKQVQDDKFVGKITEVDYEIPPKVGMTN